MMTQQTTSLAADKIDVIVSPHPFTDKKIRHRTEPGLSVTEIVEHCSDGKDMLPYTHAYLDGNYLPRDCWAHIKPKAGTTVMLRIVPMGGGGGKNPLRTVMSLAIMAASPALSGALAGAVGQASLFGISAGKLITTGVGLLGRLALNALAPPGKPRFSGQKESPTLFIQGARNQLSPFGRVPRVLGKHRFVPPLGAMPYTETIGNAQYLRMLFVWGYGPLQISDLKIGETPLSAFDGVEVETRQGFDTDAPLTLYSNSVLQNDLGVTIKNSDGYVTRTSEADADEISVDITLPRGLLKFTNSGKKLATSIQVEVQYSPAGANNWSAGASSYKSVSAQTSADILRPNTYHYNGVDHVVTRVDRLVIDQASGVLAVIKGVDFRIGIDTGSVFVPAVPPGFLSVAKVERRSDDTASIPSARVTDDRDAGLTGTIFETSGDFLAAPSLTDHKIDVAAGGLKFPGIFIIGKQSAAIRKFVSFKVQKGQYDVRVRRLTVDATDDNTFDETVWTALRTTRYSYPVKMGGIAMTAIRIKATDQLNGIIDRFNGIVHSILPDWNGTGWVEQVTSNPAALFRHVLQGSANARPLADARLDITKIQDWHQTCAAAGREFNAVIDYDVSLREVLQNIAAAGRASTALIDGKWAIVEDKLQTVPVQHFSPRNTFHFQGQKNFDEVPQALRIRFINRDKGWMQDERLVFDDMHDAATATKYETLDMTGITSSVQAWKDGRYHIATARLRPETYSFYCDIEHIICTRGDLVRFSHDVPMFGLMSGRIKDVTTDGGSPENIISVTLDATVTMEAGRAYAVRFRKADGSSLIVALETVIGESQVLMFSTPLAVASGPAAGDLALYGESGTESIELIVRSIDPQSDLSAKITCMDAAPAVHTAESGDIPAFSSQITVPPEFKRPPAPVVTSVQSGDEVLIPGADGSFASAIVIMLAPPDFSMPLSAEIQIRHIEETDFHPAHYTVSGGQITITNVTAGARYDIKIVYKSPFGISSAATIIANQYVEGATALPDNVQSFTLNIFSNAAHLSWNKVHDIDLSHYQIKFSALTSGATWANSFELINRVSRSSTSVAVQALAGTWLIKAVDQGGRESASAASIISTIDKIEGYVGVHTIDESGSAFGGTLETDSVGVIFDGSDNLILDDTLTGTYYFVYDSPTHLDLNAVYRSLVTADMAVTGIYTDDLVDSWGETDLVDSWDRTADPSTWGVQLQVRTTDEDPDNNNWGLWQNFVIGEYTARGF